MNVRHTSTRGRETSVPYVMKMIAVAAVSAAVLGFIPAGSHSQNSFIGAPLAEAQNFSQRTIQGKVVDDTGTVVGGATVFLKDLKSRSVKSFTSTADGSFRFAQVGMIDDYEVWAEHTGKKSPTKTISSFDSRKQVDFELKLK